jgi:hypothetical protein
MKIFGLSTRGDSLNGWVFKMKSKKMFTCKEGAEKYINKFEELCYDEKQVDAAARGTLKTIIIEYELCD